MADKRIQLKVVTPSRTVFEGAVGECTAPGAEGEFGVLPEHISYLTTILPGALRFEQEGKTKNFAIGTGFIQVVGDQVTILTRFCDAADGLDKGELAKELQEAEVQLSQYGPSDLEHPAALARVQDARARLGALG